MSKYCGKCDLYDHFFMFDDIPVEEQLRDVKIYQGIQRELLDIKDEKGLALYFPYICGMGSNKFIVIGNNDYIREREINSINLYVREVRREKNYCRRKSLEYIPKEVYKKRLGWTPKEDKDACMDIINRIGLGGRAHFHFDDIRLPSLDWQRKEWLEDLINKYGYNPDFARRWVYHET